MNITQELGKKGADIAGITGHVIRNPECLPELIEGLKAPKGTLRYAFEKVLRQISEQRPDLVYPYFDVFVELLDHENSFLKWGAILTIANLTAADADRKFEKIFSKYFSPITGPVMVTASNIIGSSARIALNKPELTGRIVRRILKVENAEFIKKGSPSPECRNVALGQAVDTFNEIFHQIDNKKSILRFVARQVGNSRKSVSRKAEKFLIEHEA